MRRGYARVSTRDQSLARQVDALEAAGCDEVWRESASGADFERPVWRELDATLAEGDELVVLSVDRLGRSYDEVLSVWRSMAARGVRVRALDMPILDRGGTSRRGSCPTWRSSCSATWRRSSARTPASGSARASRRPCGAASGSAGHARSRPSAGRAFGTPSCAAA